MPERFVTAYGSESSTGHPYRTAAIVSIGKRSKPKYRIVKVTNTDTNKHKFDFRYFIQRRSWLWFWKELSWAYSLDIAIKDAEKYSNKKKTKPIKIKAVVWDNINGQSINEPLTSNLDVWDSVHRNK
jgi:hypothetical protein